MARPKEEGTADAPYDEAKPRPRKEYGDSDNKSFNKPSTKPDFEEDFETVTDKKRLPKPKDSSETSFGGKPSFTRGKDKKWVYWISLNAL